MEENNETTESNGTESNGDGTTKVEFNVEPAIREFKNTVDYITEVSPGRVSADHIHRYDRWEIIIALPDPAELLETVEAQVYSDELKALWGVDLATALREVMGAAFAVRPNYHIEDVAFDKERCLLDNGHFKMQDLADQYNIGQRTGGPTQKKQVAELKDAKAKIDGLGFGSMDEAIAALAKAKEAGLLED